MFQPLAGMRVIDLTQVLAGPYAAYQLGLMGAEVLKIEAPGLGDWTRDKGPLPALNARGLGLTYLTQNANKKSVTLNLKSAEGVAILKRLLADADVFIENFRPGKVAKLGLSYDEVRRINPRIVYCSISAFGQDGAMSHRPAYDHIVQGMSGIMKTTGTEATGPQKVGAPYVDYATGLNAAFAIVSALHQTRSTGVSVHLDVAMLDTSLMLMAQLLTSHLTGGWVPRPSGNEAWSQSPSSGAFETSEGLLMLAANTDRHFRALCTALNREDILLDPRWRDPEDRPAHAAGLRAELAAVFLTASAAEWEMRLDAAGVPAARVRSLDQILAEDHTRSRAVVHALPWPHGPERIHLPTLGFKVDGEVVTPSLAPPELGGDTGAVLRDLGYSDSDLQRLAEAGII